MPGVGHNGPLPHAPIRLLTDRLHLRRILGKVRACLVWVIMDRAGLTERCWNKSEVLGQTYYFEAQTLGSKVVGARYFFERQFSQAEAGWSTLIFVASMSGPSVARRVWA